jgi:stage V sporulation protein B
VSARRTVSAGRGLIFITAAKLWFMVAAYVVQFALPRALGSPARYGVWVVVLSILNPLNNVIITGTIQGVSKFISEDESRRSAVTRAALKLQAFIGGGTALGLFALAPAIAWFEHDATLTPFLRLSAGVVLGYAFYAVFVGAANGAHQFHKQAGLDFTFATLRTLLVVGGAAVTHSALASVGGFAAAAFVIVVIAALLVGLGEPPKAGEPFPTAQLARFFGGLCFYLLIINLMMFVDGLLLKRLVAEWAARRGAADPSLLANEQAGFYGAVQNVARIPYQLILAVTFVIFPLMSRATFEGDVGKTRGYVRSTMRYSLLVAALMGAVLSARPAAVMRLFYKPEYAVGAPALAALVAGYVFFSLFNIAGTIINGSGRTSPTTVIGSLTLLVATVANWVAIRLALAAGADPLFYAALATAAAMLIGVVLSGFYLQGAFGASLPATSVVRVALSYAATAAAGWAWTRAGILPGKIGTLISCAFCGVVFVATAMLSGELRLADLKQLRR